VDEDGVEGYVDLGEDDWAGQDSDPEAETKSKKTGGKSSKGRESEAKAGAKGVTTFTARQSAPLPMGQRK